MPHACVRKITLPVVVLAVLVLSVFPAAASVEGTFERTYQVTGPVDLEVFTHSGDVTVRAGSSSSVIIRGKIHVSDKSLSGNWQGDVAQIEKNPPITQSGNSVRVDYTNVQHISIDYEITAPAETRVRSHTGSGDQTMEGLNGKMDLEAGSGDLRLRDVTGEIRTRTGSGNVTADDLKGPLTAEAGSGDIRVDEKGAGDVDVHTGSGNIEVNGVTGALHLRAGSGDVRIEGRMGGAWEVRTGSGDVELRLPGDAAFDLDATTSSGSVVVDHPVTMMVQGDLRRAHREVQGKVGGGGQTLTVHTGSGDVHIY